MRGTTSLLRLLFGGMPGDDYPGEFLVLENRRVHIFEAFALTNFLLCSAINSGQGDTGSKRGKSTATMQRNCARHFLETMSILEPTVMVAQGIGVRDWLRAAVERPVSVGPNLESVRLRGRNCLLATFTHPSVPSRQNWGTDNRRPYLLDVVAPTVQSIRSLVLAG